ncbi:MAG: hypothetical protein ACLP50_34580 [Solirubrobacteraceae bacterium]
MPMRLGPVAAIVAASISLAGCGGHSKAPVLTVSPRQGDPRSELRFMFTAPATSGVSGQIETSYTLSVAGHSRAGCVGFHTAGLPSVTRGRRLTLTLGPAELGGPWCTGAYDAGLEELVRPVCRPGVPCPQFIRVVAVGRATFTIRR